MLRPDAIRAKSLQLYKALSKDGNPRLGTVLKVMRALGLRFTAQAA